MGRWQFRIGNPLGGGVPPTNGDHFGATIIVGNTPAGDPASAQAAPFQYVPDIGDGAGIASAFAAIVAAGDGGLVHIRRGVYDFGLPTSPKPPLLINGFRVQGDGTSTILRMSTSDRRLFILSNDPTINNRSPELADIGIDFTTAAALSVGTELIDALGSARAMLTNVQVVKNITGAPTAAVINANEPLTSLFRSGLGTRFLSCRAINIDGTANLSVAAFRLAGATTDCSHCAVVGTNVAYRSESVIQSIIGCTSSGSSLAASQNAIEIAADRVRVEGCNIGAVVDCIAVLSGTGSIINGNTIGSGAAGDGIRVDLGALNTIVTSNYLNGNPLVILDGSTEVAHNVL